VLDICGYELPTIENVTIRFIVRLPLILPL